jgi:hypothetical protein
MSQGVGLGERRLVAHRREQLTSLAEGFLAVAPALRDETPAPAEESVGALRHVSEPAPAFRRFAVKRLRIDEIIGVLGELGAGRADRVLVQRVPVFEPVGETLGERPARQGVARPVSSARPVAAERQGS